MSIRSAVLPGGGQVRAPITGRWRAGGEDQVIRFLPHRGARVAYSITGRGPALLLDLGRAQDLEAFWRHAPYRRFVSRLSAVFSVLRWDRPGFGLSDRHGADLSAAGDIALVRHLLRHLGLDRVAVLAADGAGPVMIELAARHPELVSRLALFGTAAEGRGLAAAPLTRALATLAGSATGARHVHGLVAAWVARGCEPEAVTWLAQALATAADGPTLAELACQTERLDARPALPAVRAPTLVMRREADPVVEPRQAGELAAGIPGARLVTLEGSCHLPYEGSVAAALRSLATFLGGDGLTSDADEGEASPLSPRELEVAHLVTLGLTNVEIAGRLAIQRRTVEAHLEHVRAKLGIRTRAGVAAWVVANQAEARR